MGTERRGLRRALAVTVGVVLAVALGAAAARLNTPSSPAVPDRDGVALFAGEEGLAGFVVDRSRAPADTSDAIDAQDRVWLDRFAAGDVEVLEQLRASFTDDPRGINRCHELTHELGRRAFPRYGDVLDGAAAAGSFPFWCGNGYLHGMMEAWGASTDLAAVEATAATLCDSFTADEQPACSHGLGHAIMQHVPDLGEAFATCASLDDQGWHCMLGALMLFGETYFTPVPTRADQGFSFPAFCGIVADRYAGDCHYEVGVAWITILGNGDRPAALQLCSTLAELDPDGPMRCAQGLGVTVLDLVGVDAEAAVRVCEEGPDELAPGCVTGVIAGLSGHVAGDVCASFPDRWATLCRDRVKDVSVSRPPADAHNHSAGPGH